MSGAINGVIDFNYKKIKERLAENMKNSLYSYKLKGINSIINENTFMCCGLLDITEEDNYEVLPYYDKEEKLIMVADIIIDNREELFQLLYIINDDNRVITDSQILLLAYKKWGKNCVNYIIGDFSFVIWDIVKKELFCARDPLGGRTLYYKYENNIFKFSTVIEPIKEEKEELNERWIADFLALPTVMNQSEGEETIYKDIFQIPAATYLVVSKDGISKKKYWDIVKKQSKLSLKNDDEYDKRFKEIFYKAVASKLRTNGEIAIKLSGGLDSSSVAAFAAPILKSQNKKLRAFTSVPMKGYQNNIKTNRIVDESKLVEELKDMYENIDINFCRSEGRDSLQDMEYFTEVFEHPYKTYQNCFWGDEISKRAQNEGCKVVLTGQFGNFTISYGNYFTHMKTLIKDRKIIKFIKEIRQCSKFHNISIAFTCKHVIKAIFLNKIKEKIKYTSKENAFINRPVNRNLVEKYDIYKRFENLGFIVHTGKTDHMYYERRFIVNPAMLAQIGEIETKLSLKNGIIQRDPTKDKRVVEFCFSLPTEQFVRGGIERYLIRRNVRGLIPESIRTNYSSKGLQSADWRQRLEKKRCILYKKLKSVINDKEYIKYLNIDYLKEQFNLLELDDFNKVDLMSVLMAINLKMFLNDIEDVKSKPKKMINN